MERFRVSTKHEYVKKGILKMIQEETVEGNQLPSEGYLAKEFGVSLATVREALLVLKKEGVISKRHGSGNYIHRSVLDSSMRIDKFVDFIQLLEESGYEVSLDQTDPLIDGGDARYYDDIRRALGMVETEEIVHYTRLFYADGEPAIYAHNFIPLKYFTIPLEEVKKVERLWDYIWIYCGREIAHALYDFIPITAGDEETSVFPVSADIPMISWNEIFHTLEDTSICYSKVVFNPNIMHLRMLLKWQE